MIEYIYLAAGLILLLKGADWLLEGAASMAKRLNIHKLVIGMTIVAFGTSLPELFISIFGAINGNTDIVLGNLFGSNIANILLILGIGALITPLTLHYHTVWKEIPFGILAAAIVLLLSNKNILGLPNTLTPIDGIILLLLFVLFIYYTSDLIKQKRIETLETKKEIDLIKPQFRQIYVMLGATLVGVIALYAGGMMTVENAIIIAANMGVSQYFISATILAVGTSLPELFVTIKAALRKEIDLAVGNIVGSNIFNTLFILGIAALIKPIATYQTLTSDIIIMISATIILFISMFIGQKHMLKRWQGTLFLACYIGYIIYLIGR